MLTIDETYDNGVARARVGDPLRLQLSENPTTGYRWQMQPDVTAGLRILADFFDDVRRGRGRRRRQVLDHRRPTGRARRC